MGATASLATTTEDAQHKQYTARVSDENAASGRHSLRFADGPGQKASYTPHVYYRRTFKEGLLLGRFDVFVDPHAEVSYQWRQYDKGYVTGPEILIEPGGLVSHRGERLTTIPTNQWGRIEIRCRLGEEASGTFDLLVWQQVNGEPLKFEGLAVDSQFKRLDWVGFVSRAEKEAVYFVDNIEVNTGG